MRWGVVWDMDGVLVDTRELHFQTWAAALQPYAVPFDREIFRRTFGMNNASCLQYLFGARFAPAMVTQIGDHKEQLFRARVAEVQPLPGVREWLARLQAQGVPQALGTSAPVENIDALLAALDLRSYFAAIVSAADLPGKPDPAVFQLCAERLAVLPEHCVVVEDAAVGVRAAKRAGMPCVAVTTTNPAAALAEADLVVENLLALPLEALAHLGGAV